MYNVRKLIASNDGACKIAGLKYIHTETANFFLIKISKNGEVINAVEVPSNQEAWITLHTKLIADDVLDFNLREATNIK